MIIGQNAALRFPLSVRNNGPAPMTTASGEANPKDLRWLFEGPSGSSKKDVRNWWHQRRLRYNRDRLFVGILTWVLVLVAGSAAVKPGEDFEERL
jgi:hypothetical protein